MKSEVKNTLTLIKSKFANRSFMSKELYELAKELENELLLSTFRWRLHNLKASGEIESRGRGQYSLASHDKFKIELKLKLQKIFKELTQEFPYASFCTWSSDLLNEFTIHQPTMSFNIIEIEKDAIEGVFSYLKEHHQNVLLNPTKKEINLYLSSDNKSLIVKTLLQRAPIEKDSSTKISVPKIEKILVDLIADSDFFSLYQGSELKNIWREVFKKYTVNISTLNNYAKRRKVNGQTYQYIKELESLNLASTKYDLRS